MLMRKTKSIWIDSTNSERVAGGAHVVGGRQLPAHAEHSGQEARDCLALLVWKLVARCHQL